jgi:hypothetical protein
MSHMKVRIELSGTYYCSCKVRCKLSLLKKFPVTAAGSEGTSNYWAYSLKYTGRSFFWFQVAKS